MMNPKNREERKKTAIRVVAILCALLIVASAFLFLFLK